MLIVEFIQRRQMIEDSVEQTTRQILEDNYARFFILEDDFESLYDVELISGHYTSYIRGEFYQRNVSDKIVSQTEFFEDLLTNVERVVYEEDREAVFDFLNRDTIRHCLAEKDHMDYYYRIITDKGIMWMKMRIVYKDDEKKNIIVGIFDAAEEIASKERDREQLKSTEEQLRHEKLRTEVLDYMINNEDDPIELLRQFADRLLKLINCDQVIYRDLEETRIMVNSDGIKDTWSVPIEYCKQCEHFNAFHPMYSDGYTEMDNCQEGWRGIPVYKDCPIKSSLTRLVYCDGEIAGYLAIHFVQKYHKFNDIERNTLEIFTRILSISLSRYKAKQKAGELSSVKNSLNMMFSLSDQFDPIIVLNPETGEYDWMMSKAEEIEELTSMTIHGENLYDDILRDAATVIHEDDREQYRTFYTKENMMKIAGTGVTQETENRWKVGPDGTYLWKYNKAVRMVDDNGKVYVVVGVIDTTETKQKEQQLLEAREAAEAANRAKTEFLFNMSHDIRTPMNAIIGFTNIAMKHISDSDKVIDCLDKTQKAGSMLLSLINSVLEVSRIESGHATLDEQHGDVYYSFTNIENTMRELAETKDIELTFEFGDIRDRYVYADFGRCMRIFVNVISNAIKYTHEGGHVNVRCEQIGEVEEGVASYRYSITDDGIGMSEEFQKHVFEQFSREQSATVSGIQGTGLGMSVVKSFVELLGGSISVKSKLGEGTTFTIILPFRVQEGAEYTDPETGDIISETGTVESAGHYEFKGRHVLLVEDNELNREIAVDMLEEQGIIIDDADDGTVAVEILKDKGPDFYDFILMDIQMPIMNGYEATKIIRAMYPDRHIPIIALSANAFAEDRAASLAAGMDDHVSKPIKVKDLYNVLIKFAKE